MESIKSYLLNINIHIPWVAYIWDAYLHVMFLMFGYGIYCIC